MKRHDLKGSRQAILADTLFSLHCPIIFVPCAKFQASSSSGSEKTEGGHFVPP